MGFGSYGGATMIATAAAMNTARRTGYYGGGGIGDGNSSNTPKSRKLYVKWLVALSIFIGFCVYGVFFQGERDVDVSGTIFAKGTSYKHHKHYDEQIFLFAIKPDNPEWNKFDVNVTFSTYSSYNVGDKVKFNNIRKTKIGDKSWTGWNEFIGCSSLVFGICAIIGWLYVLICLLFYPGDDD